MSNKNLSEEYFKWKQEKNNQNYNASRESAGLKSTSDEYAEWKQQSRNRRLSDEYAEWKRQKGLGELKSPFQPVQQYQSSDNRSNQIASKYDGMSYADRAAALEQLKINLKNMPSPEQGAEYQYLKNNLLGAEEAQRYANMTREERDAAIMKLRAAQAGVVNTDPLHPRTAIEDAQARQAANDAMKEYAGLEYYLANYDPTMQARTRLAEYGSQKEDVGEFEYNNRQKLGGFYSDFLTGGATRLFGNKEQNAAYDAYKSGKESIAEYEARQKAYDEAIVRLGITRPEEYDELVKKGYGGEYTYEQLAKSILENPASTAVPMLRSLRQYTSRGDTLANYMYPQENAMFYALLGKGDVEGAGDYVNSLEKQLIQRAEQEQVEAKAESYKNDGVNGFVRMLGDTAVSIPENMLGSVPAFLDEVGQYVTTGEYDPYKSPDTQDVRSARQTRAAGSQYVGDITNHASIGGIEIAPLIYNAGVSALESAAGGYLGKMLQTTAFINNAGKAAEWLGKNTYIFMMGSGAAQARAEELYQRGANDKQILIGSLTAGINEALFEHFSLENIIDTDKFASYAARVLTQAGIEGSEEIATTLANQLADSITLGDVSDYNEAVRKYLAENPDMDYKTAQKLAASDAFTGLLEDGLAGMLSGFSAVNIYDAANNVRYNRQNNKIGKNISNQGKAADIVQQGLTLDKESDGYKAAAEAQKALDNGESVPNKTIGEITRALNARNAENTKAALENLSDVNGKNTAEYVETWLRASGLSEEGAKLGTSAITKPMNGEELTEAEQNILQENDTVIKLAENIAERTNKATRAAAEAIVTQRELQEAATKTKKQVVQEKAQRNAVIDTPENYTVSDDGKTTYNGKEVKIGKFVNDGNTLKLDVNRQKVSPSEISYGNKGEAAVIESIAKLGADANAANLLYSLYKQSKPESAGEFARDLTKWYTYGFSGRSFDAVSAQNDSFDEATKRSVYRLGEMAAKMTEMKKSARRSGEVALRGIAYSDDDITRREYSRMQNSNSDKARRQKASIEALDRLAKALGLNVRMYASEIGEDGKRYYVDEDGERKPAPNGKYISGGKIYIDINSGMSGNGTIMYTAAHELVHFIREWSPSKFNEFAKFLVNEYGKQGVDVNDLIDRQLNKAEKEGREITRDEAYEEAIADSCEEFLADEKVAEKLLQLRQNDPTLWGKIKEFFEKIIEKFQKVVDTYRNVRPDSPEARVVASMRGSLDRLKEIYAEGLSEAAENYAKSADTGTKQTVEQEDEIENLSEREDNVAQRLINRKLTKDVEDLRTLLAEQKSADIASGADVEATAEQMARDWGIEAGKDELAKLLKQFYTDVTEAAQTKALTWEDITDYAEPVVAWLQERQDYVKADESVQDALRMVKGVGIKLNDEQRAEVINKYGSVKAWQSAIAGTVVLRNDGMGLDELWPEWSSLHPEWFSPNVTKSADMPNVMAEIAGDLVDASEITPADVIASDRQYLRLQAYERLFDAAAKNSTAQNADKISSTHANRVSAAKNIFDTRVTNRERQYYQDYIARVREQKNAKYQELKDTSRERYELLREQKNAKIAEIKAKASESRLRGIENRKRTRLRKEIYDIASDLKKRVDKPAENKYVPRGLLHTAATAIEKLFENTTSNSMNKLVYLQALANEYAKLKEETSEFHSLYDETAAGLLDSINRAFSIGKTVTAVKPSDPNAMTSEELQNVKRAFSALRAAITGEIGERNKETKRDIAERGRKMIEETRGAGKHHKNLLSALNFMNLSPMEAFKAFGGYTKNSEWGQLANDLNEGQLKQQRIIAESERYFADLLQDTKNLHKMVDDKNLVDVGLVDEDTGKPVEITHGMMVSLYLHLLNEQNARHFAVGGLTLPEIGKYYNSNYRDAWKNQIGVRGKNLQIREIQKEIWALEDKLLKTADAFEKEDIKAQIDRKYEEETALLKGYVASIKAKIEDKLTDYDRKWIETSQKYLNEYSKDQLNEATFDRYGFEKATVDNYFPIITDPHFNASTFEKMIRGFVLENAGPMQERVQGASNRMLLEDITSVISRQENFVARYAGLLVPLKEFEMLYNTTNPETGDTVKKALSDVFGKKAERYITDLKNDLNGGRMPSDGIKESFHSVARALRSGLAKSSLSINLRVAAMQAASYPTALAVLDAKSLAKALVKVEKMSDKNGYVFSRAELDEISKWTSLISPRIAGRDTVTLAQARKSDKTVDKVMRATKANKWLTGWIQGVDAATVGRLWYAAQYYVEDHNPDLKKGSDEFYKEVAKKFNEVVERTQPVYTTMQRPAVARSDSEIIKSFAMFMTQRLQNFNILYSAINEYKSYHDDFKNGGKNGVTEQDVKYAKSRLVKAVASNLASHITLVITSAIANFLLYSARNYRDDDDELTLGSILKGVGKNFLEAEASNVVFGKELYDLLTSMITGEKYYGISLSGLDTFKDVVEELPQAWNSLIKAFKTGDGTAKERENAWKSVRTNALKLGKSICSMFGIPANNAYKIGDAFVNHAADVINGTMFTFERGHEYSSTSNEKRLYDAYTSGDKDKAKELKSEYDTQSAYDTALRGGLRKYEQRIRKAAEYYANGDTKKAKEIANSISADYPLYSTDIIDAAVKAEYDSIVKERTGKKDTDDSWRDNDITEQKQTEHFVSTTWLKADLYTSDVETSVDEVKKILAEGAAGGDDARKSAKTSVRNTLRNTWRKARDAGDKKTMKNAEEVLTKMIQQLYDTKTAEEVIESWNSDKEKNK